MVKWPLLTLIRAYQFMLSPWIGNGCAYFPTCSRYAYEAIERHGVLAGTYLAAARIGRCHPWCHGGIDLVPERPPRLFSRFCGSGRTPSPEPPVTGASLPDTSHR